MTLLLASYQGLFPPIIKSVETISQFDYQFNKTCTDYRQAMHTSFLPWTIHFGKHEKDILIQIEIKILYPDVCKTAL